MVERGEEDHGHVPGCVDETDQNQSPGPTHAQELGKQIASPSDLLSQDQREREQDNLYEEADEASADTVFGHHDRSERVAQTIAVASRLTSRAARKAIHQTFRPRRWSPSVFQPSLEKPSRVTIRSMISAASAGVNM